MTLPDERYRAVRQVREFLSDLSNSKKTPRVPKYVRQQAFMLLRHYPMEYEMEIVAERSPDMFKAVMFTPYKDQDDNKRIDGIPKRVSR